MMIMMVMVTLMVMVTRVLARPKRQGAAPESPLVSSGFYKRYFELEVAESVQL